MSARGSEWNQNDHASNRESHQDCLRGKLPSSMSVIKLWREITVKEDVNP